MSCFVVRKETAEGVTKMLRIHFQIPHCFNLLKKISGIKVILLLIFHREILDNDEEHCEVQDEPKPMNMSVIFLQQPPYAKNNPVKPSNPANPVDPDKSREVSTNPDPSLGPSPNPGGSRKKSGATEDPDSLVGDGEPVLPPESESGSVKGMEAFNQRYSY